MLFVFFFFKQKTAYELRISDWSSDVCSSDLLGEVHRHAGIRRFDPVGSRQAVAAQLDVAGDQRVLRAEGGELGQGPFAGDRHRQLDLRRAAHAMFPRGAERRLLAFLRLRPPALRSEEHTSELQSLMRNSYAVFC